MSERDPRIDPEVGDTVYGPGGWRSPMCEPFTWQHGGMKGRVILSYDGHRKPDGATITLKSWRRWARGAKFERHEDKAPPSIWRATIEVANPQAHVRIGGFES